MSEQSLPDNPSPTPTPIEVMRNPQPTEGIRTLFTASPTFRQEAEQIQHTSNWQERWGTPLDRFAQMVTFSAHPAETTGVFGAERVQRLTNMIDGVIHPDLRNNSAGYRAIMEDVLPAAKQQGTELAVLEKAQYNSQRAEVALVVGSVDDRGQLTRVDGVLMAQSAPGPARHPALEHSMPVTNPYRDTYRISTVFTAPEGIDMANVGSVADTNLRNFLANVKMNSGEWKTVASLQHSRQE